MPAAAPPRPLEWDRPWSFPKCHADDPFPVNLSISGATSPLQRSGPSRFSPPLSCFRGKSRKSGPLAFMRTKRAFTMLRRATTQPMATGGRCTPVCRASKVLHLRLQLATRHGCVAQKRLRLAHFTGGASDVLADPHACTEERISA